MTPGSTTTGAATTASCSVAWASRLATRCSTASWQSQFTSDAWELYPDVEPMLGAVREMGVHIGVVSDWGSNLRDILAGLELDRYLDFVLPSGAVGVAKPNPAFFAVAPMPRTFGRTRRSWSATRTEPTSVARGQPASTPCGSIGAEGINITPSDEPSPTDVRVIRSLDEVPEIVRAAARCRVATSPTSSAGLPA